jgi:protein-tyrosine kinase
MESIRQAIERARRRDPEQQSAAYLDAPRMQLMGDFDRPREDKPRREVELDPSYLQSRRIVAFDGTDTRSRPFDILRTEVLRSMDLKGLKTLGVTSPTPGCGKTVVAVNLALSMGRQPERQTQLVDLDLRKPQVAACLGLKCPEGALGVIESRMEMDNAIVEARVGSSRLEIMPTASSPNSSDLVASSAMSIFLQDITRQSRTMILDLPPLLTGHDVISILPQVDCILLVAAVGTTKASEIEECNRHLQTTNVVRVVLNKVPESMTAYAYY